MEMVSSFANTAARYTPPGAGKRSIPKKDYERKVIDRKKDVAPSDLSDIDKIQLYVNKRRYKVLFDRKGRELKRKHNLQVYFKSRAEAMKAAKMQHRGLTRAMWGASLGSIGAQVPTTVQDALDKSPDLKGLGYSRTTYREDETMLEVEIDNLGNTVGNGLLTEIERSACSSTEKRMNYMIKALLDKRHEV